MIVLVWGLFVFQTHLKCPGALLSFALGWFPGLLGDHVVPRTDPGPPTYSVCTPAH